MLKILLEIDWLRIAYNSNPEINHTIYFIIENQQAQQLNFERKSISVQQLTYDLDTLSPFRLHLIVGQNKHKVCPFKLQLISKLKPPIIRNISLPLQKIFDQYLRQKLFTNVQPLQVDFIFQQGQLSYKVIILDVQTVTDSQQYSHLKSLVAKIDSFSNEEKVRVQQPNTDDQYSKQSSSIGREKSQKDKLYTTTTSENLQKEEYNLAMTISFKNFQALSIQELAKKVQNEKQQKKLQNEKQNQIFKTNVWYLKLGEEREFEKKNTQSIYLKLLIALLILGSSYIMYNIFAERPMIKSTAKSHNKNHGIKGKDHNQTVAKGKQAKRR